MAGVANRPSSRANLQLAGAPPGGAREGPVIGRAHQHREVLGRHKEGSGPSTHAVTSLSVIVADMLALIGLCIVLLIWWLSKSKKSMTPMPGPRPWPVLGSMHLLGKYKKPYEAFTALSRVYGPIYGINLGSTPCVVVTNFKLIKEVLITKGGDFGGRPDFARFHKLFGGDRNNCKYIIKLHLYIIYYIHYYVIFSKDTEVMTAVV